MKNLTTFLLILLISPFSFLSAQEFDESKMDKLFELYQKNDRGMGSISIFKEGKEVYANSIGWLDVNNELSPNHESLYRIGSISKMFTAAICMKMVENDLLQLDSPLSDYYPEVKNSEQITLENLLRHRSGIANITASEDYRSWMVNKIEKEEMLERISKLEANFEAGSQSEYSNTNYILLTYILEEVSGKSFDELIESYVSDKCELDRTRYGSKINSENNEAISYDYAKGWQVSTQTDLSIPQGAGGIVSTAAELNQFLFCLFEGDLLAEATVDSMMQLKGRFGIGMFTLPFYDKTAYGHTGGIDGFVANSFYFPDERVAVTYTANGVRSPVNDLMIGVLSIYFGMDFEMPEFAETVDLSLEELNLYTGTYSADNFPLDIKIFIKNEMLYTQASGQPEFPLEALGDHTFQLESAGAELTFIPEEDKLILEQMGRRFDLEKQAE